MSQWKLTLDPPFSFAVEQGFARDVKSCDFRSEHSAVVASPKTWREPINGVVMLRPSMLDKSFTTDFKGLANWNYKTAFWNEVRRAQAIKNFPNPPPNADPAQPFALLMAPVKPAGQRFELIEILVNTAIMEINQDIQNYDRMKWVLQSTFTLAEDESFAIHYHGLTDEMVRKDNWFCLQWDNIGLHFSHTGLMSVYRYNRADMTAPGALIDQVEICTPADILNRNGYFWFMPIPNLGLAVYHGLIAQKHDIFGSSARNVSVRGKLVEWATTPDDGSGHAMLFSPSVVSIGMNPYHPTLMGYQSIRFPANIPCSVQDGTFSLPYPPTLQPSLVSAGGVADRGTLAATLLNADGSAPWDPAAPTAHLARVGVTLSTADPIYTPFLGTYSVRWLPVLATRATTPLTLASRAADGSDRLERLEWSDNADSHFEGEAQILIYSTAGRIIARRGDATFLLEHSEDGGATWIVFTGGLAKEWIIDVEYSPNWGTYYHCKVRIYDFWERLDESHVLWQMAFDSLTLGQALNNVLTTNGFAPIADVAMPADATTTAIEKSPDGHSWRYSPREGEKTQDVIALLLLYLRKQNLQYRLRFDWSLLPPTWVLEARPRNLASIWSLLPFAGSRNASTSTWDYSSLRLKPYPPEGNVIIVEGMTVPDPQFAERISVPPLINADSLSNTASIDYLGRTLYLKVDMPYVTDTDTLSKMERRYYDAAAHYRGKADIETQHFAWALAPNQRVQAYSAEGALLLDAWIKRRSVVIENFDQETMKLETDTIWEEPIGRA